MDPKALARIERQNYVLAGVAIAASALLLPADQALGILVGALLSAVNFTLLRRMVDRWMKGNQQTKNQTAFLFMPKMIALLGAVALAILFLPISAGALAIGFSIFLVSIGIETIRHLTTPAAEAGGEADGEGSGDAGDDSDS